MTHSNRFENRQEAGRKLAERLKGFSSQGAVVIALPRGGVPVAHEIARALGAPLDVLVVRKIGAPGNPEFGIGAVAEGGETWLDPDGIRLSHASEQEILDAIDRETAEIARRVKAYRGNRARLAVNGRTVILVDDGLATGVSAMAAARQLRVEGAERVILAVPVCPRDRFAKFEREVDELVSLEVPVKFFSVSQWYEDFSQTSDDEVIALLERREELAFGDGPARLPGTLVLPPDCSGVVLFAHGSGSGRHSPRNLQVASALNRAGIGTFLFDLLTPEESLDRALVFDIPFLASRLQRAFGFIETTLRHAHPIGFFGASTGGGAALWAAAELGRRVAAVVSRGGRPDLALPRLGEVLSPTLLLVGARDGSVVELNERAARALPGSRLVLIPGATHLFEEPGALEAVSNEASRFFLACFRATAREPLRVLKRRRAA